VDLLSQRAPATKTKERLLRTFPQATKLLEHSPEEQIFGQLLSFQWLPESQMIPESEEKLRKLIGDEARTLRVLDRLPRDRSQDFHLVVMFGTGSQKSKIHKHSMTI
jgi:hypothetical protein